MDKETAVKNGEYLGHGIGDDGREYSGYMVNGECYYFHDDDGSLIEG